MDKRVAFFRLAAAHENERAANSNEIEVAAETEMPATSQAQPQRRRVSLPPVRRAQNALATAIPDEADWKEF